MNVLILGSGAREHALAWKAAQSLQLNKLFCAPGSIAISTLAMSVELDILDPKAIAEFCQAEDIHLVLIGPEAPLAAGVADELRARYVRVFGPGKAAARLESSKAFAKEFMHRHKIPTAPFQVFTDPVKAKAAIDPRRLPVVVKADGLAAGKGVVVCRTLNQAYEAISAFMEKKVLGAAGETVVVEDCLTGPELSVMALVDGKSYRLLPLSRDHKRLKDNDEGPNTGGMGAFAPAPIDDKTLIQVKDMIFNRTLAGLAADGLDYRGVLYAGLMLTPAGPMALEYNCRFGDPETQAVLPLLKSDLLDLAYACADGKLAAKEVSTLPGSCVCVTLASEGYPLSPITARAILGLDPTPGSSDTLVFHAGTTRKQGVWLTSGGRVLSVAALAPEIAAAREKAYAVVGKIKFPGMQYRKDIANHLPALK